MFLSDVFFELTAELSIKYLGERVVPKEGERCIHSGPSGYWCARVDRAVIFGNMRE